MTNQEILKRIPVIEGLALQYESDFTLGIIGEDRYYQLNQELMDEIEILEETAIENNRRERFNEMMGDPIKVIEGWFGCKRT